MASAWQSMEEAAITLGVSSRTLHRRITKSEVETRLVNGRREVLVTLADPPTASASTSDTSASSSDNASQPPTVEISMDGHDDAGVQHTMLMLHEDRIRRTDLAIMAYQQSVTVAAAEARRGRIGQRVAWSVAAGLAGCLFVAVVWSTHRVTASEAKVGTLTDQLKSVSDSADIVRQQADSVRREAEFARLSAARAEGELVAQRERLREQAEAMEASRQAAAAIPATQPSLVARVLGAWVK